MFHLIPFRLIKNLILASLVIYGALFAVFFHYGILVYLKHQVNEITNPKDHRSLNLSEFKKEFSSCYISNKTTGNRNVNDNYKALIAYNKEGLMNLLTILTIGFAILRSAYPIRSCTVNRDIELMKSGFASFSRAERSVRNWWIFFPASLLVTTLLLTGCGYYLQYETLAGHFFNLGIQYLQDPGYLSALFPSSLYCYRLNEKDEERFESMFNLNQSRLYGRTCLILWFWMAFSLLVQAIVIVQLISFKHSKIYRFMRLKKFFPSVDEKLLGQLSVLDYRFCVSLEYFEFYADGKDFRQFLDYLVKRDYFTTRIPKTSTLSNGDNQDPNALALVAVK